MGDAGQQQRRRADRLALSDPARRAIPGYGTPEILAPDDNLRVLTRLVEHFEQHIERPMLLDPEYGAGLSQGTVGLRIPITRYVCKLKLSQDKDPITQAQVIDALRTPGPYQHPALADDMERTLGGRQRSG